MRPFGLSLSKPSRACPGLARARLRAGRPARSAVGGRLRRRPALAGGSLAREASKSPQGLLLVHARPCAARAARAAAQLALLPAARATELGQSSPSLGCASGNPRG